MNKPNPTQQKKYSKWIKIISIAIPLVVVLLFGVRIPNVEPLWFLPPIYATINGLTALILVIALVAIKNNKPRLHECLVQTAMVCSVLFLAMYVAYHMTSDSTSYGGTGVWAVIYYVILITHIILSIVVIPLVLVSYMRAYLGQYQSHKKIVRYAYPVWLYVAISGVVVYLMISPYY